MICLGNDKQWVYLNHFNVKWFYATSKYPVGYGVNYYEEPECMNYKRKHRWIDIFSSVG